MSPRVTRRPDAVFTSDTCKHLARGYREDANAAAAEGKLAWAQLVLADAWAAATEEDRDTLRTRVRQLEELARAWGADLDSRADKAQARPRTQAVDDSDSLGLGLSA